MKKLIEVLTDFRRRDLDHVQISMGLLTGFGAVLLLHGILEGPFMVVLAGLLSLAVAKVIHYLVPLAAVKDDPEEGENTDR